MNEYAGGLKESPFKELDWKQFGKPNKY